MDINYQIKVSHSDFIEILSALRQSYSADLLSYDTLDRFINSAHLTR